MGDLVSLVALSYYSLEVKGSDFGYIKIFLRSIRKV